MMFYYLIFLLTLWVAWNIFIIGILNLMSTNNLLLFLNSIEK